MQKVVQMRQLNAEFVFEITFIYCISYPNSCADYLIDRKYFIRIFPTRPTNESKRFPVVFSFRSKWFEIQIIDE